MSQAMRRTVDETVIATMASLLIVAAVGCNVAAPEVEQAESDPLSDGASNVRLVGYHDLQGRQSLQLTTRSDAGNGNWAYVGHQPNDRPDSDEPQMNTVTGEAEINGTSLLDITDPVNPVLTWHIPGISRANHRAVSVVYDYTHDGSDRDYLVRSADTGDDFRFQIFDITDRATDPESITLVSEITGTPPNSCGPGCGGPFIIRAHKGFWSEESGYYYTASGEPGFRNTLLHIWDLRDPTSPTFVGRAWLPGMKDTEDEALYQGQYVHHPTIDEVNNRMYIGFRNTSGLMGAWDISDRANPTLVWSVDTNPPNRGPHTLTPIVYDEVPNFHGDALPRTYIFMTDEAAGGRLNRHENRIAWLAYFNAGVRVLDLSDPYNMRELGYYIPKANAMSHPIAEGQPAVIQINDVTIDHRGLAARG